MSRPAAVLRRSSPPLRTTTSIKNFWADRPLLSAALGAGVRGISQLSQRCEVQVHPDLRRSQMARNDDGFGERKGHNLLPPKRRWKSPLQLPRRIVDRVGRVKKRACAVYNQRG